MAKPPSKRLGKALEHADELSEQIQASLPPPQPKRGRRVLLALGDEEYQRLAEFAEDRGDKLAPTVRNLALAALEALGR